MSTTSASGTQPTTPAARTRAMSAYSALSQAGYKAYTRDKTTLFFTFAFPSSSSSSSA